MGKKTFLIISISLIIVLIIIAFLYYALAKPNYEKPTIDINKTQIAINPESVVIEPNHISYILAELDFYQLRNPPLSSDTPKINIKLDETWFNSQVEQGKIHTKQGSIENPDIIIYTSSDELIEAMKSDEIKEYMKTSVSSGKTQLELKASYSTLFSKGYLSLYQELTGKTLTGSVIRIFGQG